MRYWLIKSEPSVYPYERLVWNGRTTWDGVRNAEARNNLRAMAVSDLCLYYHSNEDKAVVGVAEVARAAYPDPTAAEGEDWSVVDVVPAVALAKPVTLAVIKSTKSLSAMVVARRSRLSVTKVTAAEFRAVLAAGETGWPKPA
jgi:predicted RNA-binding protein with PUA-like domain